MDGRHIAVIVGMVLTVVTACGPGEQYDTTGSPAPTAEGTAAGTEEAVDEPIYGGIHVAAVSQDPGHLNPAITTGGGTHTASELLYNGLVRLGAHLETEPDLASPGRSPTTA